MSFVCKSAFRCFRSGGIWGALVLGLGVGFSAPAVADDESEETEIRVTAPIDAVSCNGTSSDPNDPNAPGDPNAPSTVTVLGLVIDITDARIKSRHDDDDGDGCSELEVGQTVRVRLVNDIPPLVATRVEDREQKGGGIGQGREKPRIQAPIQAIDLTAMTITVLGLPIDVTTAVFEGADDDDCEDPNEPNDPNNVGIRDHDSDDDSDDDDSSDDDSDDDDSSDDDSSDDDDGDGDCPDIDLSQLVVGQFVHIKLDADALESGLLVATDVEVKNFTNAIQVLVLDSRGRPVRGAVTVRIVDSVRVRDEAGRMVTRRFRFITEGAGRVRVAGLPTGQARVTVRRSTGGRTTTALIPVTPDRTRRITLRLR